MRTKWIFRGAECVGKSKVDWNGSGNETKQIKEELVTMVRTNGYTFSWPPPSLWILKRSSGKSINPSDGLNPLNIYIYIIQQFGTLNCKYTVFFSIGNKRKKYRNFFQLTREFLVGISRNMALNSQKNCSNMILKNNIKLKIYPYLSVDML